MRILDEGASFALFRSSSMKTVKVVEAQEIRSGKGVGTFILFGRKFALCLFSSSEAAHFTRKLRLNSIWGAKVSAYKRANFFSFQDSNILWKLQNLFASFLLCYKKRKPSIPRWSHLLNHARTNQKLIHHRPTTLRLGKKRLNYLHFTI